MKYSSVNSIFIYVYSTQEDKTELLIAFLSEPFPLYYVQL